ncbi:MAG TPA: sugar-binding domain-containing protein [Anaerovoracaceae bacterium]|nr:sugar-binding domain-containing protein [Anaerovoracaceae bacterium]
MNSEVYNQSTSLILKAAYLYYLKEKPQHEIADSLDVSIPTVSRLIKKAKDERIVEFVIRDPYIQCIETEENLKRKLNLKDVVIAPVPTLVQMESPTADTVENVRKTVALEGARYIQRIITEEDILGISWGKTIHELIHFLNPCQKINAGFVTMHGSIIGCSQDMDVRTLVARMSMAFGGRNYSLLTEGFMSSKGIADSIKSEKNVKRVFEMFEQITISLCSVGAFYPQRESLLYQPGGYVSEQEMRELSDKKLAGDIALRFFDTEGRECDTSFKERTLGINLSAYRKIKTKIIIAAGEKKTQAVLGALKGGLADVLITDYHLGKSLLDAQNIPS